MQVTVASGRSNGGGAQDLGQLIGIRRRSTIEPVPAEPENKAAKGTQSNGVAQNSAGLLLAVLVDVILTQTRPEEDRADQSSQTADHVNHGRTRKIVEAQQSQPALSVP